MSKHFAKEQHGEMQGGQFVLDCSGAQQFIDININREWEQLIPPKCKIKK